MTNVIVVVSELVNAMVAVMIPLSVEWIRCTQGCRRLGHPHLPLSPRYIQYLLCLVHLLALTYSNVSIAVGAASKRHKT